MENSPRQPEDNSFEQDYQQRRMAPEASQLHGKGLPPETIGHVLMSGEGTASTSKEQIDWLRAAGMTRDDLLRISQDIKLDGTSLRHVYDTHLIGENGLRRLVYEHMRGGNLHEVLRHEILQHETDFERDPRLRAHPPRFDSSQPMAYAKVATDAPSLNDLLAKAGLVKLDPGKELTAPKLLPDHAAKRSVMEPHQRRLLDIAFVSVILLLIILVVLLVISRR